MASYVKGRCALANPIFGDRSEQARVGGLLRVFGGTVERSREPHHECNCTLDVKRQSAKTARIIGWS